MERIILSIRDIVYLALGTFVPGLVTWDAETTAPRPLGRPQILGEGAVRLQATVVDRFLVSQNVSWTNRLSGAASPSAYTS